MSMRRILVLGGAFALLGPQGAHADVPWAQGFEPTAGYMARQAEYLNYCAENGGPEKNGGIYSQVCRLATDAGPLHAAVIYEALDEINAREDTADFELNALLRMMTLYGDHPELSGALHADIEDAIINFKYWLDEPGPDTMCWWSENHQILFHAAEMMAGLLYPDRIFTNSGMTGAEHVAHAMPMIETWLDRRAMFGFSEWHSNVYFNEDIPAILNVVDFAEDELIATKAAMVMDLVTYDLSNAYFNGVQATVFGRTYPSKRIGGARDSTRESAYILLDAADYASAGNLAGSHLATSQKYWPPPILEEIRNDSTLYHEHRQRDGIDLAEGPDYGIGYTDYEDIMFWWGMGAYASAPVIEGTFEMVDHYNLWEGFFWSDVWFLKPLVGSPILKPAAIYFDDLSRGSALESMSTYTYRTPHYQLSGAQDYNPGLWGAQQHMWEAVIDDEAYVFTSYPGGATDDYAAGAWTGGWLPRATLHKNVGIFQYHRDDYRVMDDSFFVEYSHAYFPKSAFDLVESVGHWVLGKKGDSYVALYSQTPATWSTDPEHADYELIADAKENTWIIELGSIAEFDSYEHFRAQITATTVQIDNFGVDYLSPSQGAISVGRTGPMTVANRPVDLGPFARWDNDYSQQEFGSEVTVFEFNGSRLTLDFETVSRHYEP